MSSLDVYDNGLESSIISTSVRVVTSLSYVNLALPIDLLRHLLVDLTIRSNIPPHHGAFSRLKIHCRPTMLLYYFTSGCVSTLCIDRAVDLKVFPLLATILCGNPFLDIKRLKHQRKASTVMFGTMSRCTVLTTQHVNKHIHTLFSVTNPWVLTYSGPAKSSPTYVNAGSSHTLNWGNGGGRGAG